VAVLVSRSGETVEVVKLLPLLRETNVTSIGVTNVAGSRLAREADHTILIGSASDQFGVAVQTYTSTIMCLYIRCHAILEARFDASFRKELQGVVAALLQVLEILPDSSRKWMSFLQGASAIHLLARGPSLSSAMEGAILFNEVAKVPAVPMGASVFRHGPVE